jgi:hypothetical protein
VDPLFAVTDPAAEALGHYAGTDDVAVARKELDDHTAWYVTLPSKDPALLRSILHRTGAHVYSDQGDVIYAGSGLVMVHTAVGGPREVTLLNGTRIAFELPPGPATVFLDAETGALLLGAPTIPPSPGVPRR